MKGFPGPRVHAFVFKMGTAQSPSAGAAQIFAPSALFPPIQNDTRWNQLRSLSIQRIKMLFLCIQNFISLVFNNYLF